MASHPIKYCFQNNVYSLLPHKFLDVSVMLIILVHVRISLIHTLISVSFLDILILKKVISVTVLSYVNILSVDVAFFETQLYFSTQSKSPSFDPHDIPLPVPISITTSIPSPPSFQVYTRRCQKDMHSSTPPVSSLSVDPAPISSDTLPIALCKGTHSCIAHYPISSCNDSRKSVGHIYAIIPK
jgi:hypothetical protein